MVNTVTRNPSLPDRWHSRDSRLFGRLLALSNGVFAISLTLLSAVDSMMYWYARRRGLLRPAVTDRTFYRESVQGAVTIGIFAVSIPLLFVFVSWTPIVWVLLLPIDRLLTAVLNDE